MTTIICVFGSRHVCVVCAHTHMYWYDTKCLFVLTQYNECIRLVKNSVEVCFKINYVHVKVVWWLSSVWHWQWIHNLWVNDLHLLVTNCLPYVCIYNLYVCVCVCGSKKKLITDLENVVIDYVIAVYIITFCAVWVDNVCKIK
jgi:hypothetical protein